MIAESSLQLTSKINMSTLSEIKDTTHRNAGILHQFIQKKTKRGRKSKHELPKEEKCQICLEFIQYSFGALTKCTVCKVQFHTSCYKTSINNNDSFKCERCLKATEENKAIESYKCFICNKCDGVLYEQQHTKEFYHEICLRFIPELCEESHEELISKPSIRRWRYKNSCKYCKEKLSNSKAVIKCSNPRCKCYYHIPCAIQKGMIISTKYLTEYFDIKDTKTVLPFFCSGHNKRLVASYRNDILFPNHKEDLSAKTALSAKDTTEEVSEYGNNGNETENEIDIDNDNNEAYVNVNEKEKENDELFTIQGSNALNLNFNEMLDESQWAEGNNYVGNINYISPKDKIFFDFNYQNTNNNTEDCSLELEDHFFNDLINNNGNY